MTSAERDALIERAMERLHRLKEKEEREMTEAKFDIRPAIGIVRAPKEAYVGVVKGAR